MRDLGWRRTLVHSAVALVVGGLAENGSVHFGVPYTRYTFNSDLRGDELRAERFRSRSYADASSDGGEISRPKSAVR